MKHIKRFQNKSHFFNGKIDKLIPEMYVIFEYNSIIFFKKIYNINFLILGKVKSLPYNHPDYEITEESNTFIEINIIEYISDSNELEHDPVNGHNTGLELDIALNIREKKYFNIDLIKNINYTSSSLKQSQIEFEKQTEEFQIKFNMNKYNL